MENRQMRQRCVNRGTSSIKVKRRCSVTPLACFFSTDALSAMKVLLLVCVLASLLVCTPPTEASQISMRLCGREFLRAVVYTCGGSRWRRSLNEIFTQDSEPEDTLRFRRSEESALLDLCCSVGCRKSDLTLMC
ncbi:insulin-like 5b [Ictalurus furcatus]|uniref:insulin-like 5b n=1 Tax=Ictalurus furcatus TaxID=66913 RepID=UPI002350F586|nr:insulin-like 5b [Ictalurus furcatus]